jgi:hypothetical protein
MEKDAFRSMGTVNSLKECRLEREESYGIMYDMHRELQKQVIECYKECRNDVELSIIPRKPILEAWKSFSIVSREVNYFGYGDMETWLENVDKLGEKFFCRISNSTYEIRKQGNNER